MRKSPQKEKMCFKLELASFGSIEEGVRKTVSKVLYLLGCDAIEYGKILRNFLRSFLFPS